jgi:hypothetical protein
MALSTSRISRLRGRPPDFAAGISGLRISHWASVRSVSYAGRIIVGSPIDPFTLQLPFFFASRFSRTTFQTGSKILKKYTEPAKLNDFEGLEVELREQLVH